MGRDTSNVFAASAPAVWFGDEHVTGELVACRRFDRSGRFGLVDVTPGVWMMCANLPDSVVGGWFDVVRTAKSKVSVPTFGQLFAASG